MAVIVAWIGRWKDNDVLHLSRAFRGPLKVRRQAEVFRGPANLNIHSAAFLDKCILASCFNFVHLQSNIRRTVSYPVKSGHDSGIRTYLHFVCYFLLGSCCDKRYSLRLNKLGGGAKSHVFYLGYSRHVYFCSTEVVTQNSLGVSPL